MREPHQLEGEVSHEQLWKAAGIGTTMQIGAQASALRAAIYLRVSTGRQVEQELSIPDQRAQMKAWVVQRGWRVAAEYIEHGASATDDKRPESNA